MEKLEQCVKSFQSEKKKTPEGHLWYRSDVFNINFETVSLVVLMPPL